MKDIDAAWLAGFLDGDGSFMITRTIYKRLDTPVYQGVISAASTDIRLVNRIMSLVGGKYSATKPKSDKWKVAYVWSLYGPAVDKVVEQVMPYLVSKREAATLVWKIREITTRGSQPGVFGRRRSEEDTAARRALYLKCKAVNQRGSGRGDSVIAKRRAGREA